MPPDLLTTLEAAEYLGISDETLRRWAKAEKVRHVVLPSGHRRFRRVDLDEALTERGPVPTGDAA